MSEGVLRPRFITIDLGSRVLGFRRLNALEMRPWRRRANAMARAISEAVDAEKAEVDVLDDELEQMAEDLASAIVKVDGVHVELTAEDILAEMLDDELAQTWFVYLARCRATDAEKKTLAPQ